MKRLSQAESASLCCISDVVKDAFVLQAKQTSCCPTPHEVALLGAGRPQVGFVVVLPREKNHNAALGTAGPDPRWYSASYRAL